MKFLEEYRDPEKVRKFTRAIQDVTTQPWVIMEICGGQTHAIVKFGLDRLLPAEIQLVHGPGCPVCVTPIEKIDKAIQIAAHKAVIFCSFGDMLRVPGSREDLFSAKAKGADIRILYSPLDALTIAQKNPDKEVVFMGIGFETTAPAIAMCVHQARRLNIHNFSLLTSLVLVPPAIEAILASPNNRVQGFLAAGHVCTIMGYREYLPIVEKHQVPIVVTGFEPLDILQGIYMCIQQLENQQSLLENQYTRAVSAEGNRSAQQMVKEVFQVVDQQWRGVGSIPRSGLGMREEYLAFDAEKRFDLVQEVVEAPEACIAGLILQGIKRPHECPEFGKKCVPEKPLGAPMVSSEGACAAYYRYQRNKI